MLRQHGYESLTKLSQLYFSSIVTTMLLAYGGLAQAGLNRRGISYAWSTIVKACSKRKNCPNSAVLKPVST